MTPLETIPTVQHPAPIPKDIHKAIFVVDSVGFIGVAILIGISNYVYRVATGDLKFTWLRLLAESMLSGVAGYLAWSLCSVAGISYEMMGFCTGIAGWAGSKAMLFFEMVALKMLEKQFGPLEVKAPDVPKIPELKNLDETPEKQP
jgi:hypothetical protein